jgi:serine phosphatase RsbU (regulator of sigma subunit)
MNDYVMQGDIGMLYHQLLEEKKDLVDGLAYAANIQTGIYPKKRHFERAGLDAFIFHRPRYYVSGDFYWVAPVEEKVFFVAGDCTGHGMSGAMLTMLAVSLLNYVILNKGVRSVNHIMMELDMKFLEIFDSAEINGHNNDWVDMTLCCYDKKSRQLHFSSANRKLLHVSEGNPVIYTGVNYPVGGWQLEKNRLFHEQKITVRPGDSVYIGSDGFQTQFGGQNNKKYGSQRLHNFLEAISEFDTNTQEQLLSRELQNWTNGAMQTDDILVLGIRF